MTITILGIVSALIGFVVWFAKRSIEKNDTPQSRFDKREAKADKAIASGDADAINLLLSDLDRLHDRQGDPVRSSSTEDSAGPAVHVER